MQLNYSYKFLAQSDSLVPTSPWQTIQIFLEKESEIIEKLVLKGGSHIDIREVENGTFIERYELAQ